VPVQKIDYFESLASQGFQNDLQVVFFIPGLFVVRFYWLLGRNSDAELRFHTFGTILLCFNNWVICWKL